MSTSSTQDRRCEDEVSLAYISDTPIFPVTKQTFVELERTLSFSMYVNKNLKGHVALDRASWSMKSICNRLFNNAYG